MIPLRHALLSALAAFAGAMGCGAPTAPVAATLAFSVQPTSTTVVHALSPAIQVEVRDGTGTRVANAQNAVTLALGTNPGGAVLAGTTMVNTVSGIATFNGVSLDKVGTGYTLVASAAGLTGATIGGRDLAAGCRRGRAHVRICEPGLHVHLRSHNEPRLVLLGEQRARHVRRRHDDEQLNTGQGRRSERAVGGSTGE